MIVGNHAAFNPLSGLYGRRADPTDFPLPDPALRTVASLFLGTAPSISSAEIVAMVVHETNIMCGDLGQVIVVQKPYASVLLVS